MRYILLLASLLICASLPSAAEELEQQWGTDDDAPATFQVKAPSNWWEVEAGETGEGSLIIHPEAQNDSLNHIPAPDRRLGHEIEPDIGQNMRRLEDTEPTNQNLPTGLNVYRGDAPQTDGRSLSVSTPLPRN